MDCINCPTKSCRKELKSCPSQSFNSNKMLERYLEDENQKIVQAAAELVDNGRAGTLSKIEEVVEFSKLMGYSRIGLAYCYGMEKEASLVADIFKANKLKLIPISCATGALSQKEVNQKSELPGVSCNPISQAEQLNLEQIDFAITMGLCMGHDILFQNNISVNFTNILVKDRTSNHCPMKGIKEYKIPQDKETK